MRQKGQVRAPDQTCKGEVASPNPISLLLCAIMSFLRKQVSRNLFVGRLEHLLQPKAGWETRLTAFASGCDSEALRNGELKTGYLPKLRNPPRHVGAFN